MKCKDCKWWYKRQFPYGEVYVGICRRHAPIPDLRGDRGGMDGENIKYANWPDTYYEDWCGEFEAK